MEIVVERILIEIGADPAPQQTDGSKHACGV
jgi:hypothetical protein